MKFKSEVQLEALNNATVDTDKFLVSDSSAVKYRTGAQVLSDIGGQSALTNPVTGTGTLNFVSKFTSTGSTLGNSQIFDNGTDVGIGTSGPLNKVDIVSSNNDSFGAITVRPLNQTQTMSLGWQGVSASLNFIVNTGAVERMRITSTGNVGIGTTSPNQKLHVNGATQLGDINAATNFGTVALKVVEGTVSTGPTLGSGAVGAQAVLYSNGLFGMYTGVSGNGNTWMQSQRNDAGTSTYNILLNPLGGKVGIGTSSPVAKLDIGGASGEMIRLADSSTIGNPFITFFQTSTRRAYIQYVDSGDNLTLASEYGGIVLTTGTGGTETEKMRITSSGEVGIGTTSPLQKLHVVGNVIADDLTLGGSESTPTINFTSSGGARASIDYNNSTGSITLENKYGLFAIKTGSGGSSSERMRITNAGNVGIGTTNPTYKLHVVGEGYFSSTLIANKVYTTQVCNTSTCNNSSVALTSSGVRITRNIADSSTAFDVTQTNASSTGAIQTWSNSAGEKMRVTQSGDVGIGITSPNAILDVAGDALINGVTIGQGPAVGQQNTVLGKRALGSIVYASANIAIGDSCNTDNDATGLTTIGVELNADTNLDSLNQDCLAISQYNSNAYSNQVPHIYVPKPISIGGGATNIITFDVNHYAGAIVEYMIRLNDGGDYAVGTVYMGWKSNGTGNMIDVRQIEYSDMSGFVFSLGGSGQTLVLTNTSGNNAWVRITVRGMMTN
jgi:uncharacterized membrane protein